MIIGKPVKQLVKMDPIEEVNHLGVIWKFPGGEMCLEGVIGKYQVVGLILAEQEKKKRKEKKENC